MAVVDPSAVLAGAPFADWLTHVTGTTENSPISPSAALDPHGTSLRTLRQGLPSLIAVETGAALTGDVVQRRADLRAQELVANDPAAPSGVILTALGNNTLNGWRRLGVANQLYEDEPVRALVLLQEAKAAASPGYTKFEERWASLVELAPAASWLERPNALYLYSYLNREVNGYNPWTVLADCGLGRDLQTLERGPWDAFAASQPNPPGWTVSRLAALLRRAWEWASRAVGRQTFCVAMEARRLASTAPLRLVPELLSWSILVA